MKKAKVTFFVAGILKTRIFEFYGWANIINDMNNSSEDGHGWINDYEILKIELVPEDNVN